MTEPPIRIQDVKKAFDPKSWAAIAFVAGCAAASPPAVSSGEAHAVPAAAVATGHERWFDVLPREPLLNVRVDLGTLRSVAPDEIEYRTIWPMSPALANALARQEALTVPLDAKVHYRERAACTARGPVTFSVERWIVAVDGREVHRKSMDARAERAKTEAGPHAPGTFGEDRGSLACLAAASKCSGRELRWPPPPRPTTLESSDRADRLRADYNAPFLPSCQVGS